MRKLAAAGLLTAVLSLTAVVPAYATQQQVCGNGGTGYCLNDWGNGGSGNAVKMYNGGNTNENFRWIPEKDCNRGGLDGYVSQVTSVAFGDATNCPFSHVALDNKYWNHNVGEIQYSNGYCTATDSLARVVLGQCEEGGQAANGVVMVEASCGSNYAIDRYWSDNGAIPGTEYTLTSGGNPGVQAIFSRGLNTCWGGI